MASDTRKIVIEIMETTTEKKKKKAPEEIEKEKKDKLKKVIQHQAINTAKQLIVQSIETGMSQYVKMKENYMLENDVNAVKNVISKGLGVAATLKLGAAGGPAGLAVASVGLVVSEAIQINARWRDVYSEISTTNYNKTFTRTRYGLTDGGRGTEN